MAEKKQDRAYATDGDEQRPPLAFLVERDALVRRFVLAELLGPPRALGPAAPPPPGPIAERMATLAALVADMAEQRRSESRLLLLGDADALADACFQPILDYARGQSIRLAIRRAATFIGDKDL